jgi:hypothetical protein
MHLFDVEVGAAPFQKRVISVAAFFLKVLKLSPSSRLAMAAREKMERASSLLIQKGGGVVKCLLC